MNLDKRNVEDILPATPLQQGMIYHALAADDAAMYLEQYGFSVYGDLEPDRYRMAWQQTLDQQPMLRTTFLWEGLSKAYQVVHKQLTMAFEHVHLGNLEDERQAEALDQLRQRHRTRGFDLNRGPLFSVSVVSLAAGHHKVWLTLHHLLADGWSLALLLSEVSRRYQSPALPIEAPIPFRRYCEWLETQDQQLARQWWEDRFSRGSFAGSAPLAVRHHSGTSQAFDLALNSEDSARWRQGCSKQGLTESTVFSAAWAMLLSRYLHQDRVVFGCTVSTRPPDITGIDHMLGLLLNVLPVGVELDWQKPTAAWLQDFQRQLLSDRKFDYLPLSELQRLAGTPSEHAMFETLLVWENQPGSAPDGTNAEGLQIVHDESYERNHYPLMLAGFPGAEVRLRITCSAGSLSEKRALSLLKQMLALMLALADGGSRPLQALAGGCLPAPLPSLPPTEQRSIRKNGLWEQIVEVSQRSPEALQLSEVHTGQSLSRMDLVQRSRNLARQLASKLPPDRNAPIAILLWPGTTYVCAILAALQLGRPWLALDPRKPIEGLYEQLRHVQPSALVTEQHLWPNPSGWEGITLLDPCLSDSSLEPEPMPKVDVHEDECACMVLTSGSTGQPKCVRLPHRALRQRLAWMEAAYPANHDDCMILKTSPAFVDAVCEILGPLLAGYPMVALAPEQSMDLEQLHRLLVTHSATRLVITPSVLDGLIRVMPAPMPSLRLLQVSGERFPHPLLALAQRFFPHARILNVYGSSEVMADASTFDCTGWTPTAEENDSSIPIGRLLPGIRGVILDVQEFPVPEGGIGELYLGGECLAIDYYNDPVATAARFKTLNGLEERPRMYATGDLVSLDEGGYLHFHGREDHQIKFNGIRIEPAEIESLLRSFNRVDDAAVACHTNASGNSVLAAHIVSPTRPEEHEALISELKGRLARHVAGSLIPGHWQIMPALPKNTSGKLDRKALRLQPGLSTASQRPSVPPQNAEQQTLAKLWREVLKLDAVGIDDDFFAVGGNSISMTQLSFAIRKAFHVPYPIRAAFQAPTIREQADLIRQYQMGAQPVLEAGPGARAHHDLHQDAASADTIQPLAGELPVWGDGPIHIFMSGAQGFINAWLLARLLDEPAVRVSCLAPGSDSRSAAEGLADHLQQFGLWTPARKARLHTVAGELGLERFGLSTQAWDALTRDCQVLLHTGVEINFVAPYERLRASNAMSTATMLALATTSRPKPLHFIGSLGVIDHSKAREKSVGIRENDPMTSWKGLPNGYLQARWVSDTMVRRAIQRGIPCSVIRMTTVSGDSTHHRANPQDMMWQLFKLAMTVGIIPDSPRPIDLVPVDLAVDAVVRLAKSPETLGYAWHVSNPRVWTWREVAGLLHRHGYPARVLPGNEWSQEFGHITADLGQHTDWQKVLPLLGDSWLEYPHFFPLDKSKTLKQIHRLGLNMLTMDEHLLWRTVESFIQDGLLPPAAVQRTPVHQE